MNTSRIRDLAKQQGKSVTYICKLIDRPKYYLNDVDKKPDRMISDEDLKTLAINLGTTAEYLKGEPDGYKITTAYNLTSCKTKTFRVPLSAYPNPTLCGERCSFKPKDTPYLNR